jgi:hypothetical protein
MKFSMRTILHGKSAHSKTLEVYVGQTTRCHYPGDSNILSHCRDKVKSHLSCLVYKAPPCWRLCVKFCNRVDFTVRWWCSPYNFIAAFLYLEVVSTGTLSAHHMAVTRGSLNIVISQILTYLLAELSPSWEAANCAATQEIPAILRNPKVHHRVHKSPPMVPILSQFDPVHTIPSYLSKIHFNIVHPPMSWSSSWSLSGFPTNILCVMVYHLLFVY